MKYLGKQGGWRTLATACLKNAIKTSDLDCVRNDIFSTICELAEQDENEVIVDLIFADRMKRKYGNKWYKVYAEKMNKLYGKEWYRRIKL